jgi:hypothetical protein
MAGMFVLLRKLIQDNQPCTPCNPGALNRFVDKLDTHRSDFNQGARPARQTRTLIGLAGLALAGAVITYEAYPRSD